MSWRAHYSLIDKKIHHATEGSYTWHHEMRHQYQDENGVLGAALMMNYWMAVIGTVFFMLMLFYTLEPVYYWLMWLCIIMMLPMMCIEVDAHIYAFNKRWRR